MLMRPACGARAAAAARLAGCLQRKASADAATRGAVGAGAARPQSVFGGGRESTSRRSLSHRQVHPAHLRPQEAPPLARPRRPSVQFSFRRQTRRFRPSSAVWFFFCRSVLGAVQCSSSGSDSVRRHASRRVRRSSAVVGEPLKKRRVERASSAPS